jgi:hypothetical protein
MHGGVSRQRAVLLHLILGAAAVLCVSAKVPASGAAPDSVQGILRVVTTLFGGVPPPTQQQQQLATKEQLAALNSRFADALLLEGLTRHATPAQVRHWHAITVGACQMVCYSTELSTNVWQANVAQHGHVQCVTSFFTQPNSNSAHFASSMSSPLPSCMSSECIVPVSFQQLPAYERLALQQMPSTSR